MRCGEPGGEGGLADFVAAFQCHVLVAREGSTERVFGPLTSARRSQQTNVSQSWWAALTGSPRGRSLIACRTCHPLARRWPRIFSHVSPCGYGYGSQHTAW